MFALISLALMVVRAVRDARPLRRPNYKEVLGVAAVAVLLSLLAFCGMIIAFEYGIAPRGQWPRPTPEIPPVAIRHALIDLPFVAFAIFGLLLFARIKTPK